jgi:DNA-directed RNA polymerase specialized sigma24 family protein
VHILYVSRGCFALYLSGDPALADDITSETFVRVWSSPEPVR